MSSQTSSPAKVTNDGKMAQRDPFELLKRLQLDLDRFWSLSRPTFGSIWPSSEEGKDWIPSADIFEREGNLVIKAELPGIKKEDLDVSVEDGALVIHGERHAEEEVNEKDYHRMERSYGSFRRRIALPIGVTSENISACFQDGVLEVTAPLPVQQSREIAKIKVS